MAPARRNRRLLLLLNADVHQRLFYQVREQYKNETEGNLGTFSFDDRTNVITFNPTKDFSDEDLVSFSCQVLNVTETNLTIKTDEGELLNYTKTTMVHFRITYGKKRLLQ